MSFLKHIGFGISMGCTAFVIANLIGYWSIGDLFLQEVMHDFTEHATGSIIVGLACILPADIYKVERLSFLQQSAIHFFTAIGVFLAVAFSLKWIPAFSLKMTSLFVLISVVLFACVWFLFYLHSKAEVKKMQDKIKRHSGPM